MMWAYTLRDVVPFIFIFRFIGCIFSFVLYQSGDIFIRISLPSLIMDSLLEPETYAITVPLGDIQ